MSEDEARYGARRPPEPSRSSGDADPPLTRWLEDDSPWPSSDDFLRERRVDRHRRSSSRGAAGREAKHSRARRESRSRVVAVVVLVLAAVTIAITGLETRAPIFGGTGSENSVPFSLLPVTVSSATSTTATSTTTSAITTSSTTSTSITSTTAPAADGASVEALAVTSQ